VLAFFGRRLLRARGALHAEEPLGDVRSEPFAFVQGPSGPARGAGPNPNLNPMGLRLDQYGPQEE